MRHESLADSPVQLMEGAATAPRSKRVLPHTPEACDRVEVLAAVGGEEMALQLSVIMCQGGGQFFGPIDATAIDDHDDLFGGCAKEVPDWMHRVAQGFCVKRRHDLREDF